MFIAMIPGKHNEALNRWQAAAPYWDKYRKVIERMFAPLTSGLIEEARIGAGQKVLDVGGGSGAYSLAFCAANSQLTATILDFTQTIDTAKYYAQEAGLASRIAHLGGNAITTDWPSGHDVVLMSYLWSAIGDEDVRALAQRAMDALPPGGLVLVHDFMVDNSHEGPPFAAWYLLGSIIDNPNAVCLTPSYVEDVLRQVGFNVERSEMMLPGITMLTRAKK